MNTEGNKKVFIQANESQYLGALLGKYAIERTSPGIPVEILQVEKIQAFQDFLGKTYLKGNEEFTYSFDDEQAFTLTRFMPPERMRFKGRAVVFDPDVFAVRDIRELFELDMKDGAVACCLREPAGFWDTSMMLLDNEKLNWRIENILGDLHEKKINYNTAMRKVLGTSVKAIPRTWNDLDHIDENTRMIHMTRQRTQPWKTGLPFTVTPRKLGKVFFGLIPREWTPYGRNKYPALYQEHSDKEVKTFFFGLVRDAISDGAIKEETVRYEIDRKHVRPDIFRAVEQFAPVEV